MSWAKAGRTRRCCSPGSPKPHRLPRQGWIRGSATKSGASSQRRGDIGPPWRTPRVTGMGSVANRQPGAPADTLLSRISRRTAAATVGGSLRQEA
eukprot:316387-Alexandrium_andersonii.AAC.1